MCTVVVFLPASTLLGLLDTCQRPYCVEQTGSHPNSEVKRHKARIVLGWVTAREVLWVLLAFSNNYWWFHKTKSTQSTLCLGSKSVFPARSLTWTCNWSSRWSTACRFTPPWGISLSSGPAFLQRPKIRQAGSGIGLSTSPVPPQRGQLEAPPPAG